MTDTLEVLADQVHQRLLRDETGGVPGPERVRRLVAEAAPLLDDTRAEQACRLVMARVVGIGALEPLLGDPEHHRRDGQRRRTGCGSTAPAI